MATEVARPAGIRGRVASGLRWKIGSQVLQQGSRSAVAIVVAHLLTPREFGLAAIALVFSGFGTLFADLALGAALIQRRTITEEDRSTVFWTQLALGALLTGGGVALAPAAASFFAAPAAAPLCAATATISLISGFGLTQAALLARAMDFRRLELREMTATVAAAVLALVVAELGGGAWAIVVQAIAFAGVSTALIWRLSSWRPRRAFSRASLRAVGPFGFKVSASRVLGYVNLSADNILIGRVLGTAALGTYAVAYNVMFLPVSRLAQPIQQVLFPAFARLQSEPRRLGLAWLRGNRLVAMVLAPAFVGMAVVAPDFVPLVLGSRWDGSVRVLQLLSLGGVAQSFQFLNAAVLQGLGRPGLLLRFMVFSSVLMVGSFALGIVWGIVGVAALFAVGRTVQLLAYTWLTAHVAHLGWREVTTSIAYVLLVTVVVGGVALLARALLLQTGVPAGVRLLVCVLTGASLYVLVVARWQRDMLGDLRSMLATGAA